MLSARILIAELSTTYGLLHTVDTYSIASLLFKIIHNLDKLTTNKINRYILLTVIYSNIFVQ